MNNLHIHKGDEVVVLSGKDKGKKGKVLKSFPTDGRVLVEGINMVMRHTKARRSTDQSGILKKELPIHASKLMRICPKCGQATRAGRQVLESGVKARACKKCGEIID